MSSQQSQHDRTSRWIIESTLKDNGFHYVKAPSVYEGKIIVDKAEATIRISISDTSFSELPKILILDTSGFPEIIAHNLDHDFCYAAEGSQRLDIYNPGGSILRVLEIVKNTLQLSISKSISDAIAAEFPRYWNGLPVYVVASASKHMVISSVSIGHQNHLFLDRKRDKSPYSVNKYFGTKIVKTSKKLTLDSQKQVPDSLAGAFDWLGSFSNQTHSSKRDFAQLFLNEEFVMINGANGWVGFRAEIPPYFKKKENAQHFRQGRFLDRLINMADKIRIERVMGIEADAVEICRRNLNDTPPLMNVSIGLIGCGTVGSHLARFLVQNGAGINKPLLLVDNDYLSPANIGRHLLDFEDIEKQKASALAEKLRKIHLEVNIHPINLEVISAWERVKNCDLLIDATGAENVSDALNRRVIDHRNADNELSIIHTWIWGRGIATQTFLHDNNKQACYRCLRPDISKKQWRYDPRKDVHKANDLVAPRCSDSAYAPFSVASSAIAAALCLEQTLDWARGKRNQKLRTMTISQEEARSIQNTSPAKANDCPACG